MTTMQDVRAELDRDEPDYPAAALALGKAALPHLKKLVEHRDPMLASKAAYLAGLLGGPDALAIVETAANRPLAEVRVAAAAALRGLDAAQTETLVERLLVDMDSGVRKAALHAVGKVKAPRLRRRLEGLAGSDPEPFLRSLAQRRLEEP
jgi:HEAT repeat protein